MIDPLSIEMVLWIASGRACRVTASAHRGAVVVWILVDGFGCIDFHVASHVLAGLVGSLGQFLPHFRCLHQFGIRTEVFQLFLGSLNGSAAGVFQFLANIDIGFEGLDREFVVFGTRLLCSTH